MPGLELGLRMELGWKGSGITDHGLGPLGKELDERAEGSGLMRPRFVDAVPAPLQRGPNLQPQFNPFVNFKSRAHPRRMKPVFVIHDNKVHKYVGTLSLPSPPPPPDPQLPLIDACSWHDGCIRCTVGRGLGKLP